MSSSPYGAATRWPHRISFGRTKTGAEVDFVWEASREDIPIEVKWTDRPRPEDVRHVERFLDEPPPRARLVSWSVAVLPRSV